LIINDKTSNLRMHQNFTIIIKKVRLAFQKLQYNRQLPVQNVITAYTKKIQSKNLGTNLMTSLRKKLISGRPKK
jgi:hypothetical protein